MRSDHKIALVGGAIGPCTIYPATIGTGGAYSKWTYYITDDEASPPSLTVGDLLAPVGDLPDTMTLDPTMPTRIEVEPYVRGSTNPPCAIFVGDYGTTGTGTTGGVYPLSAAASGIFHAGSLKMQGASIALNAAEFASLLSLGIYPIFI